MTRDAMVALDLPRDPTLRVSFPEPPVDFSEPNSLTPEQLAAFLEAMRNHYPQHYALVATLAYTGLRFCHASALPATMMEISEPLSARCGLAYFQVAVSEYRTLATALATGRGPAALQRAVQPGLPALPSDRDR